MPAGRQTRDRQADRQTYMSIYLYIHAHADSAEVPRLLCVKPYFPPNSLNPKT